MNDNNEHVHNMKLFIISSLAMSLYVKYTLLFGVFVLAFPIYNNIFAYIYIYLFN